MFIFPSFLFVAAAKISLSVSNSLPSGVGGHPEQGLQCMNINNPKSETEMTSDFNPNVRSMLLSFVICPCGGGGGA